MGRGSISNLQWLVDSGSKFKKNKLSRSCFCSWTYLQQIRFTENKKNGNLCSFSPHSENIPVETSLYSIPLILAMNNKYWEAHICQCLTKLATSRRHSPITISDNRTNTGQQFVDAVLDLSLGLSHLGLKPGDVVAISALNSDLYLEWLLAVAFLGGITAPLNYRWNLDEAISAMGIVKPVLLVTDTGYVSWHSKFQADSVPSLRWHVFMNGSKKYNDTENVLTTELIKKPSPRPHQLNYSCAPEGIAIICFTSGTTGRPKGVTLSHSALIVQSLAKIAIVGYSEDDVYLHTAPLCHIGGISSAMAMLMIEGCHVLIPKFEANSAIEAIELHHVTSLITVPAIMSDVVTFIMRDVKWKTLLTVKKILNGGGTLSVELLKDARKVFPRAKLLSAYGMTEACSSLTFMTLYDPTKEPLEHDSKLITNRGFVHQPEGICVGKPAPHIELQIQLEDSSHAGRILTRGPHLMLGYWGQNPTMETTTSGNEGWLDTGDIGRIDDHGNLWLIGRTKGRIKSAGENVYPEEVESVLSKHPGISMAVVIGIPDMRWSEMVVACIQLKSEWNWAEFNHEISAKDNALCLSSKTLQRFCRENNLTGFKIPKRFIIWRKPFPLTSSGKLRRDQLRTQVMAHMQLLSSSL